MSTLPTSDAAARFWGKVRKTDGCWHWTGGTSGRSGYGKFGRLLAHRWAYERYVGPIPDRHDVDHDCHNRDPDCPGGPCPHRLCVRPAHLVARTRSANTRLGHSGEARGAQQRAKERCRRGHLYDEENTRTFVSRGYVVRACRACAREDQRAHAARKRTKLTIS